MRVKLFAYLAESIGSEVELDLPKLFTATDVLEQLQVNYPEYAEDLQTCRMAVNQKFAAADEVYHQKNITEIAVIPPVSGG